MFITWDKLLLLLIMMTGVREQSLSWTEVVSIAFRRDKKHPLGRKGLLSYWLIFFLSLAVYFGMCVHTRTSTRMYLICSYTRTVWSISIDRGWRCCYHYYRMKGGLLRDLTKYNRSFFSAIIIDYSINAHTIIVITSCEIFARVYYSYTTTTSMLLLI